MASTAEAARLTEAHRLAQARVGARTVQAMAAVWPLLDPQNLDETVERWLRTSATVIGAQRATSARLAGDYLQRFKVAELGIGARSPLILAEAIEPRAVTTSLMVTGPGSIRSAVARGVQLPQAAEVAQARTSAAAMRHALNGGRETITRSLAADRDAEGWRRVTSGDACDFCTMLASRGGVFRAGTATFDAHDGCSCSAEPAYR